MYMRMCRLAGGGTAADIDRRCFLPSPFCTITSQSMLATYTQAIWLLCDCQCLSQTSAGLPEGKGGSALCPHLCEGTGTDKRIDRESEGENERERQNQRSCGAPYVWTWILQHTKQLVLIYGNYYSTHALLVELNNIPKSLLRIFSNMSHDFSGRGYFWDMNGQNFHKYEGQHVTTVTDNCWSLQATIYSLAHGSVSHGSSHAKFAFTKSSHHRWSYHSQRKLK